MVDAIQRHEKAYEQAHRKVDENTEVYALIIKQVNGNMTHVCTKADDSTSIWEGGGLEWCEQDDHPFF